MGNEELIVKLIYLPLYICAFAFMFALGTVAYTLMAIMLVGPFAPIYGVWKGLGFACECFSGKYK